MNLQVSEMSNGFEEMLNFAEVPVEYSLQPLQSGGEMKVWGFIRGTLTLLLQFFP